MIKQKKLLATFLLTVATVGMAIGSNFSGKNTFFWDLNAEDHLYEMDLLSGNFEPLQENELYGVFSDGTNEFFYLSHGEEAAIGDLVLNLQAKDALTPAVFCNKTVINGLYSVTVEFDDGPLYAIATSSFFERYEYVEGDALTSGVAKTFSGADLGYLLILSPTTDGAKISNVTVKYSCMRETDKDFFFAPGVNHYTGARSWGANMTMRHDYVEFTTNPNPYNNNYSVGKTNPGDYNDRWYRWNGASLRNYRKVNDDIVYDGVPFGEFASNSFEIITSVMVEPRVFYNPDSWFSVAPWVALQDEDHLSKLEYMQSYIGTDNYDPIGGINLDRTDNYRGRFYTNYAAGGGGYSWGFVDPGVRTVVGSEMTLREAYEATNLPFFHVRFEVIGNSYSVYINGFKVEYLENFLYEDYTNQKYTIDNICLHGVNYGLKDGTAGTAESEYDPYRLTYLNPIVREIV